eukprot:TRINITY_DN3305_c0_g2_i7.p1 TRINITY_DN3305_c0_g2~~TRINITY_DN3305_c0_g2_i7.p1  ORF type:complete len:1004 (+),score=213.10 TRINITY_DN3305_c0_g2_i7:1668-4679(+)
MMAEDEPVPVVGSISISSSSNSDANDDDSSSSSSSTAKLSVAVGDAGSAAGCDRPAVDVAPVRNNGDETRPSVYGRPSLDASRPPVRRTSCSEAGVGSSSAAQSAHERRRDGYRQQLLAAEREYVAALETLLRVYVRPLEQLSDAYIGREVVRQVFGECEAFYALHSGRLAELLAPPAAAAAAADGRDGQQHAADAGHGLGAVVDALHLMLETLEWAYEAAIVGFSAAVCAWQEAVRRSAKLSGWLDKRQPAPDPVELLLAPLRQLATCADLVSRMSAVQHVRVAQQQASGDGRQQQLSATLADSIAQLAARFDALDRRLQADGEQCGDEQLQQLLRASSGPEASDGQQPAGWAPSATTPTGGQQSATGYAAIHARLSRADQLYQLWRIQRCLLFADGAKSQTIVASDRRLVLCGPVWLIEPGSRLRQPCTVLLFNDRLIYTCSNPSGSNSSSIGRRRTLSNPPAPLPQVLSGRSSQPASRGQAQQQPSLSSDDTSADVIRASSRFSPPPEGASLRVLGEIELSQCLVLSRRLPGSVDDANAVAGRDPRNVQSLAATSHIGGSSGAASASAAISAAPSAEDAPRETGPVDVSNTDFQVLVLYDGEYTLGAPTDADRALWMQELDRCSLLRRPVFRDAPASEAQRVTEARLSERDWQLILGHAQHFSFPMNETILPAGTSSSSDTIYRVMKGRVRLERQGTAAEATSGSESKVYTLARLPDGAVFGESAVLDRPPAQYAVVADAEQVVVAAIELAFVAQIIRVHPSVAVKFFRHLAYSLTQRLTALPSSLVVADDAVHEAILRFNLSCKLGARYASEQGVVDGSPAAMASFLRNTELLDKRKIGEYLGEPDDFNTSVLQHYLESFEFSGLSIDQALRLFVASFRMPGEAQKIDRMMEAFASRYFAVTQRQPRPSSSAEDAVSGVVFSNQDQVYVLSFSMMMLNTDLHNDAVRKKMSRAEWIRNNRGLNNGADFEYYPCFSFYAVTPSGRFRMLGIPRVPTKQND